MLWDLELLCTLSFNSEACALVNTQCPLTSLQCTLILFKVLWHLTGTCIVSFPHRFIISRALKKKQVKDLVRKKKQWPWKLQNQEISIRCRDYSGKPINLDKSQQAPRRIPPRIYAFIIDYTDSSHYSDACIGGTIDWTGWHEILGKYNTRAGNKLTCNWSCPSFACETPFTSSRNLYNFLIESALVTLSRKRG